VRLRGAAVVLAILVALAVAGHQGTAQSVVVSYPAGWAVVGGPEGSILRGAVDRIYTLRPGDTDYRSFSASSPLRAGWGYWAFFPDGGSIDLAPGLFTYTITPDPGQWLMVGNPSSYAVATISGATVQTEQLLGVGRGAFVMANGAVTVSVPPLGRVPPGEQIVAPTALPTPRITGQSQPSARCSDGSFDYSGSVTACAAGGGVLYWIPGLPEECIASTCATPAAATSVAPTTTAAAAATPQGGAAGVAVTPASGAGGAIPTLAPAGGTAGAASGLVGQVVGGLCSGFSPGRFTARILNAEMTKTKSGITASGMWVFLTVNVTNNGRSPDSAYLAADLQDEMGATYTMASGDFAPYFDLARQMGLQPDAATIQPNTAVRELWVYQVGANVQQLSLVSHNPACQ
jgi:hypothetical protein